jgi:arylsulfatase A-like enzyme
MHWAGEQDNGYEPWGKGWIGNDEFLASLSDAVRERLAAEGRACVRRTTGGPGPRTTAEHRGHYVMQRTIEDITASVEAGQPFLAWASFSEPHPPFYPPTEFYRLVDQSKIVLPPQAPEGAAAVHPVMVRRKAEWAHLTETEIRQMIAGYYGLVAMLDMYVGQVLGALDALGIADNTIVIWSSDHGDQLWEHELFLKFVMRESSVRVPLMFRIPGRAASEVAELVEHVDVFATVCELLGVETPRAVQGRSLVPLFGGEQAPEGWRDAVFSHIDHCNIQANVEMIRTSEWKLNVYDGEPGELYDMVNDPGELRNLAGEQPHRERLEELHSRLKHWRDRCAAPSGLTRE